MHMLIKPIRGGIRASTGRRGARFARSAAAVALAVAGGAGAQEPVPGADAPHSSAERAALYGSPVSAPVELEVTAWLGAPIVTSEGDSAGEIENLLITQDGAVVSAVIAIGGWLDIGEKLVTVPYEALRFDADGERIHVARTRAALASLPDYDARDRAAPRAGDAEDRTPTADAAPRQEPIEIAPPPPLEIDPELAEIDPRLGEGIAANEAAFGEKLDHEQYDDDDENEPEREPDSQGPAADAAQSRDAPDERGAVRAR
jgi:hypothetical protein